MNERISTGSNGEASDRLDSWKAIADYLNRDVATARRWEKSLGLPVRRVAGSGRSVFAYKGEIDAWLQTSSASAEPAAPLPPPVRRRAATLWAFGGCAIVLVALVIAAAARMSPGASITRLDLSAAGVIARDAAGNERWRYAFATDVKSAISDIGQSTMIASGRNPAAYVVIAHTIRESDQLGGPGSVLEFSIDGRLRRSFSFDDEYRFRGQVYGGPWVATTIAVDDSTGPRRVAVAGHHYLWDPSPITILDEQWRRIGTFVHAGWVEALHWMSPDRLLIGGYSESRAGGMVALLDTTHLDGQGPEDRGTRYWCENCGDGRPLRMIVMPRTEVNQASGWRFNRAFVDKVGDRVVAHTIELELGGGGHADVVYEFTSSLDLVSATFSDRYWDAHRTLEAQGKLTHSRADCPDRDGPRSVLVWDPAAGWITQSLNAGER